MELTEALRTTGAVRDFTDEPVTDDVVYRILEIARFAPNGGNRQAWRIIVVKDPSIRTRLRDLYLGNWYEYLAQISAGLTPWAAVTDRRREAEAVTAAPDLAARAKVGATWVRRALRPGPSHAGPGCRPHQARFCRP